MISRLWQKFRCRMGWHVNRNQRFGVWCYSVCVCCDYVDQSHFMPQMNAAEGDGQSND